MKPVTTLIFFLGLSACTVGRVDTPGMLAFDQGDFVSALPLLEQDLSDGVDASGFALGDLYYRGQGVEQDMGKAETLFLKSAMSGDARGAGKLITFYKEQSRCESDSKLAKYWGNVSIGHRNIVSGKVELHNLDSRSQIMFARLYDAPCEGAPRFEWAIRQWHKWAQAPKRQTIVIYTG